MLFKRSLTEKMFSVGHHFILLTWCQLHPWLYDEGGWPEIINLFIKIKERSSNIHYLCKKVELIVFTEKLQKLWDVIGSKNKLKKKVLKKLWSVQKKDWKKSLKKVVIGLRGRAAARSGLPTPLGDPTIHFCQRTFANCHFLFLFVFVLHI